ncbi:glycosyltransferase family 2 protein [Flavivirga aquimarina]|uniref:Glycosyltransferase family 2 protein n=1 Tax=Flavivirga aquimarina TaxID=2027862 RepID=A0ABT8WBQ5_9FLAO|nr:glycosyltransferase family 2 protein [Flavivirga aquimarina]MDO5970563.1 glycosyltransferase family 2 protein [Flavivirga aquimarina]
MSFLFSIIIPTYNRAHLILETLKSVQKQTCENFECIVVDDHSEDDTEQIVKAFCETDDRFYFLKRPTGYLKGANACRNFGFENSKGAYINWLDSDDLITEDHLEKHAKTHEINQDIEASVSEVGTFFNNIGDHDELWLETHSTGDLIEDMLTLRASWQTASVLWKRSGLPMKPFREDLSSSQEWTFHLLRVINGVKYSKFDTITVYVRRHEDRIGKDTSEKKYRATFHSRYIILKTLYKKQQLKKSYQKALINKMLQAVKKAIYYKYDRVLLGQMIKLCSIIHLVKYKKGLLKVLFIYIPAYRILRRGETLFKL